MDSEKKEQPKEGIMKPEDDELQLKQLTEKYLKLERVSENRKYIERLFKNNDLNQLQRLVGKRLTFGTAGIRGSMGPGFGQMNDLVIIQTSQGLCSYLLEFNKEDCLKQGVIIGNDARHNSSRFARLTALAFLQKGIPVYFCDHIIPTPLIAFGVKHFKCVAGIVITASHNPKTDNGYKVYWSNGAQILSPHDKGIQEHIMRDENQKPWPKAWNQELLLSPESRGSAIVKLGENCLPIEWSPLLFRIHKDLTMKYLDYIDSMMSDARRRHNQESGLCITYTTMHGVGHTFLSRALGIAGFDDIFPVELQKKPDPEFSTVKFPNPEEAGALDLAFETAKHANSNLILAVDPDADRCACALYDPRNCYKRVLNGNEIGSLLGWWLWHSFMNQDDELCELNECCRIETKKDVKLEPSDCYMISTAVSSKFLLSMAQIEGFHFVETLTGFKYMGNVADTLINERNKRVLFAYEEAIGYMVDSRILDKDGISAAIQLAQCAAYVSRTYARSLEQHLDWLYTVYGYHFNLNSYYICTDANIIKEIFTSLQANYPTNFGPKFKVCRVRDLNSDFDSETEDKKCTLPTSTSSYMITFFVNDDITFTIRTSGTEPKIKYYSEIISRLPPLRKATGKIDDQIYDELQLKAKESTRNRLREFIELAIERCLRPSKYDLEAAD